MDEILIDEKKYISSKQAAKITGYAKDYIGQLCREGRVPARLVGRSWYVLETAMQDHRFGAVNMEQNEEARATETAPALPWTRQSQRYETFQSEEIPILPTLLHAKDDVIEPAREEIENSQQAPESLQNSWRAWFDRVGETIESVMPAIAPEPKFEPQTESESTEEMPRTPEEGRYEDNEVNIPIHTIYQSVIQEPLPRIERVEPAPMANREERKPLVQEQRKRSSGAVRTIRVIAVLIAITAIVVAVAGSGYVDEFVISSNQAMTVSGISVYNK